MRTDRALLPLLILLSACVATPTHRREGASYPGFAPLAFFAGDTVGEGVLKISLMRPRNVHVVGHGEIEADGTLLLVQRVRQGDKPERTRTWRIHRIAGDRYAGTLSDAKGPVALAATGNLLHITYVAVGGLHVEQWIVRQPGGQTALNRMVVRKLGVRIAALHETISRR